MSWKELINQACLLLGSEFTNLQTVVVLDFGHSIDPNLDQAESYEGKEIEAVSEC